MFATCRKGISVAIRAIELTSALGSLRPMRPLSTNPAKGMMGRSQRWREAVMISPGSQFHQVDRVDVQGVPRAEDGNDDGQSHSSLGCRHDHHEEDKYLPADLVPVMRESHEGQVDGVEHQLNRHENGNDIALDQKRRDSNGEEAG